MSKLITIKGYEIKITKKEVANKLEMIANDCKGDIYGVRKDITCVMCGIAKNSLDNIDYNNVKRVFTIGCSYGRYTDVNSVSLKSNANLTECVYALMIICDDLLCYGNVEYVDKLLPNYRPVWFTTCQEIEETQADTVNAEPDTHVNVDVNTSYPAKEKLNVDINTNYPVKDTNNLTLSDTAKTHIKNAYNWVIGELINGLCDNKPVSNEYKECFNMLHGGEKLVNHIYNECMENGFDVGWCGLGQAPAEIKKYDSWLIKNHIRNMLELDNIFSLPANNDTVTNEIYNIPAIKMNSILDLIEQCNSTMEKSMLIDYVSFETGVSYDAIRQIYDDYIKETFLDDDGDTFDSVLNEIIVIGWVVGSDDDIDADFKKILGSPDDIPF